MGGSMPRTHPTTMVHVRTHLVTLAKPDQVLDNPLPSSIRAGDIAAIQFQQATKMNPVAF